MGHQATGKTTTLINLVKEKIKGGMDPTKIGFMSFSRKAATEAKDRATSELNLNTDQMIYFRTLHSLGFYLDGFDYKTSF